MKILTATYDGKNIIIETEKGAIYGHYGRPEYRKGESYCARCRLVITKPTWLTACPVCGCKLRTKSLKNKARRYSC